METKNLDRRSFMKGAAALVGLASLSGCAQLGLKGFAEAEVANPAKPKPISGKIRLAGVGCGGKGSSDIDNSVEAGCEVVALCDVDERQAKGKREKYPNAKFFKDYRVMLKEMGDQIDAVTVSTPDHMHFHVAAMAIQMGKHVYVQKPLAHSIWEVQELRRLAAKHGVITQMGNQGHAGEGIRLVKEWMDSGTLGEVKLAHVWTNRPIWPQGLERPKGEDPVPEGLDWNLWLGTAPMRPYKDKWPEKSMWKGNDIKGQGVYAPFQWRGFWDFGTGALGDMGCHTMDAVFWALNIKEAMTSGQDIVVTAKSGAFSADMAPDWEEVIYEIPARGKMPACTVTWRAGGKKPDLPKGLDKVSDSGQLIMGSKMVIYDGSDYCDSPRPVNETPEKTKEDIKKVKAVAKTLPRATNSNPHIEWVEAIQKGDPHHPGSNFLDYSTYLAEFVILGNLAVRSGKKVVWNSKDCKVKNLLGAMSAMKYVKHSYRKF
jgi:predicted dehydrogenase